MWPQKPLPIKNNKDLVESLIKKYEEDFVVYPESQNWNKPTKALIANRVSLSDVLEFISEYRIDNTDSNDFAITLATLGLLSKKGYKASIILMGTEDINFNNFVKRSRTMSKKVRKVDKYDEFHGSRYTEEESYYRLTNFHQGRNDSGFPGGKEIYDKAEKTISIQVHKINVKNKYTNKPYDSIVLAIKTPTTANLITEIDDQEF